ncbi:MAG TPA: serine/threonine-protein kinase [Polyangiaceae bacterium]|nr:serine/threonine-protein kinase [Polyangiaceae bacterium]
MSDATVVETDPQVGRVLADRYRIVKLLGSGGMGSVYRAEHVHMKKPVAVKILHRHMTTNAEVVARFEQEAVAAGRIEHPNVAAATDFGKLEDGSFYLALEYVEGKSLGDVIDQGPLSPYRALVVARQIAEALGAAHAAGIVHRDLKPDNVLLVERDGLADFVKVLDFGIAKLHVDEGSGHKPLTQIGTIFGTPQYMSPEQGQGRPVDGRSDLYALGIMLYEMLSGKLPFDADDLVVLITRQVMEAPPPLPDSIPAPVRALTAQLLEKKPEARVQSAAELVERIDELLGELASSSRAPGVSRRASAAGRTSAERRFSQARSGERPLAAATRSLDGALAALRAGFVAAERTLVRRVPALGRSVTLGGTTLPLFALLGGGLALALLGALLAVLVVPSRASKHRGADALGTAQGPATSDEARHGALVSRALTGDPRALAELDALPSKQRTLDDARALGHGRCAVGEWAACMAAYRTSMQSFTALRQDPVLLADVYRGAFEPAASEEALRLAAHQLGEKGLDLLWDVWQSSRQKPELQSVNRRARQFLDDTAVREHASRELSLVFDVERAEKRHRCADAKALLSKVAEYGDDRLLPLLDRFKLTRGCGFVDLADCWECLRGNKDVATARAAAAGRHGPSFGGE